MSTNRNSTNNSSKNLPNACAEEIVRAIRILANRPSFDTFQLLEELIQRTSDNNLGSLLISATRKGIIRDVDLILDSPRASAIQNYIDDSYTEAIRFRHVHIMRLLYKRGVRVERNNFQALLDAIETVHYPTFKCTFNHCIAVTHRKSSNNFLQNYQFVLHCCRYNNPRALSYLLKMGAVYSLSVVEYVCEKYNSDACMTVVRDNESKKQDKSHRVSEDTWTEYDTDICTSDTDSENSNESENSNDSEDSNDSNSQEYYLDNIEPVDIFADNEGNNNRTVAFPLTEATPKKSIQEITSSTNPDPVPPNI